MLFFPDWTGRLALALIALCFPLSALAQARMTADEAVENALSNAQWQQEWQAGVDLARGDLTLASTLPNPSLVASREDLAEPGIASGSETSLMLSQPFDLGGRRAARIRAAEAGLVVAEATSVRDRQHISAETRRAYFAAVAAQQHRDGRAKTMAALESLKDIAEKRRSAGDLSGYEARRIRQAAEQARVAHADAEAEVYAARAALIVWAGATAASAILDDTVPLPKLSADREPRSAELDVLASEQVRAEAELQAASRLSLPVTVGVGRKRVRLGDVSDDALVLEVGVGLPLFDRQQGERARARATLSLAEARRERAEQQLLLRRAALLAQARARIASAERIATVLLPEAAQLTDIAKASFSEGELDLVALLDAFDTEATLVERGLQERLRALDTALALEALMPTND